MDQSHFPDEIAFVRGAYAGVVDGAETINVATTNINDKLESHEKRSQILVEMVRRYNKHDEMRNVLERILESDKMEGHIPPVLRKEAEEVLADE